MQDNGLLAGWLASRRKSRLSLKRNATFRRKVVFYLSETILFPSRASPDPGEGLVELWEALGELWEGLGSSGTALRASVYINKLPINRTKRPLCYLQ